MSRFRFTNLRSTRTTVAGLVAAGVLVLALGAGTAVAGAEQGPQGPGQEPGLQGPGQEPGPEEGLANLPPVPAKVGCYSSGGEGNSAGDWQEVPCLSSDYIQEHIPLPQLLPGIARGALFPSCIDCLPIYNSTGPNLRSSQVVARPVDGQGGQGPGFSPLGGLSLPSGEYSVQDNTNYFAGTNGLSDAVQFTDNTTILRIIFGGSLVHSVAYNAGCVWQVKSPFGSNRNNYAVTCVSLVQNQDCCQVSPGAYIVDGEVRPAPPPPGSPPGTPGGTNLVTRIVVPGGRNAAVVTPDKYGLGQGGWSNVSGSILGNGGGSQAMFNNTEEKIGVAASTCVNFARPCSGKLFPLAFSDYAKNNLTASAGTVETNNLTPVEGSPPTILPPLTWAASGNTAIIKYTATTSGKCWTGSLPYCE